MLKDVFTTEINSVTDNPTIFVKEDKIISGGNFHGQPLAMALDYLAIGLAELGSISERRSYQLISGERKLPAFSSCKTRVKFRNDDTTIYGSKYCESKQTIVYACFSRFYNISSNGQEDHVSMGANAATKLYRVVKNTESILAIELLNAAQAIAFKNKKSSDFIENILDVYRDQVSFLDKDRVLYEDIKNSITFLQNIEIDEELL